MIRMKTISYWADERKNSWSIEETSQVVRTDKAETLIWKTKGTQEKKMQTLKLACRIIRVIHVQLIGNEAVEEFIGILKRFFAKQVRLATIYYDNAKMINLVKSSSQMY